MEEKKSQKGISDASLRKLLSRTCDYMEKEFGSQPTTDELTAIAKCVIKLFPSLQTKNSSYDGIVSVFAIYVFIILSLV